MPVNDIEKLLLEATKNLLDQKSLGLEESDVERPGSSSFQFQYETINDQFSVEIVKSNFFDSLNAAFHKVHSYKYLEDPTFEAAFASDLRSMGVPQAEIELGLDAITKVRKKILGDNSEINAGWAGNLDEIIQISKDGGNGGPAFSGKNKPFGGVGPDNVRPEPIK